MSAGERTATDSLVDSVHPTLPRWATHSAKSRRTLPEMVGRYRVGRRLGQGGAGTVHIGRDDELDREVAIKFVPCGDSEEAGARVLREARALARLSHPNIVQIYDYGRHDEHVYIVMELVEGRTLGDWLEQPSPWSRRLELFVEIGDGLAAAHAAGVVHRDFKPSNVIVGADGRPRILDLGLARLGADSRRGSSVPERLAESGESGESATPPDEVTTREGAVMGTPKFMSPEQWAGREVDPRTDQFSYCLCLFIAVYGEPPFLMDSVAAGGSGPTIEVPAGSRAPFSLRRILARGLEFDPQDRFESMDALIGELRPLLRRRRWMAMGLVGLVAIAAGAGYGLRIDPAAACDEADPDAPQWTEARRDGLAQRFADTERAYADDSFAFTDARLVAFVGDWNEQAQARCLAEVRGELTDEAALGRRQCLLAQAARFERTVEILGELDADTLDRSAEIVRSLPQPVACEDPRRAIEPAIQAAVDRADLLRRAARYDDALAALELEAPVPATVLHVRGLVAEERGEPTAAAEDLQAAFVRAELEERDGVAAAVATDLVRVYGYRLAKVQAAEALAITAQAKVDRVAPEHDPLRADLAAVLGRFALGRGDPAAAAEHLERAVALREALDDELGLAADLNLRAQAQAMLGEVESAQKGLRRALQIRTEALGPEHPLVGSNRLNLGHVASMQRDSAGAIEHFREAKRVLEAGHGADHPQAAAVALALANELADAERSAEAEAELRHALEVYDARGMTVEAAKARSTLGLWLLDSERIDAALTSFEAAASSMREALGPNNAHLAKVEFNTALALAEAGRHEDALAAIERAAAIDEAVYGLDSDERRKDLAFEATILNELERHAEAVALLDGWLSTAEPSIAADAKRAVQEYARAQLRLGRRPQALAVLERWRPVIEEAFGADAFARLHQHVPEVWDG